MVTKIEELDDKVVATLEGEMDTVAKTVFTMTGFAKIFKFEK